jgi:hypothetical protein
VDDHGGRREVLEQLLVRQRRYARLGQGSPPRSLLREGARQLEVGRRVTGPIRLNIRRRFEIVVNRCARWLTLSALPRKRYPPALSEKWNMLTTFSCTSGSR